VILSLQPDNKETINELARVLVTIDKVDEAIELYIKLTELVPESPSSYLSLGVLYMRKENYNGAEEVLKRGLAIAPEHDEMNFYLATVYEKTGKLDKLVESLKKTIEIYNENRQLMKKLYDLRMAENPPISGSQVFEVLKAGLVIPKDMHNRMLKELLAEIPNWPERKVADLPRVMIWTHIFEECNGKTYPNFIRMTEELGGEVVGDELHRGSRYYDAEVEVKSDALEALGERYLAEVPHSFKIPIQRRIQNIMESVEKYRIDGLIFFVPKYCQADWFQQYLIEKALKEKGLPYLTIETLAGMPEAPVRTRLEAFLEMLEMG
jgi:benzoyl-CoA reductase/2-hydroxyglutaryl-CoA dehydratase subunit BcrC/BadD/HgdB